MAAMQVFNTRSYGHSGSELMRLASADSRGRIEQLYEMLAHLDGVTSLDAALREILRSSLELLGADSGYIRLFGAPSIETEVDARLAIGPIAAQSGFSEAYVDYFSSLRRPVINEARSEVYGGRQVLIADVMTNPAFLAHRDVVVGEGFHSMQVTPLIDEAATRHVGAIVACHEGIYTPPPEILALVTLYTRRAAGLVAYLQEIEYLRRASEELTALAVHRGASLEGIQAQLKLLKESAYLLEPEAGDESGVSAQSSNPYGLTWREMEVLMNVWQGLSDKEIAFRLGISRITTSKHLGSAMRKMDVQSRTQAALRVEREAAFQRLASKEPRLGDS